MTPNSKLMNFDHVYCVFIQKICIFQCSSSPNNFFLYLATYVMYDRSTNIEIETNIQPSNGKKYTNKNVMNVFFTVQIYEEDATRKKKV